MLTTRILHLFIPNESVDVVDENTFHARHCGDAPVSCPLRHNLRAVKVYIPESVGPGTTHGD